MDNVLLEFDKRWTDMRYKGKGVSLANTCSVGVPILDIAFGRIMPNDTFLIGSRSGSGKTQFVMQMALKNTMLGKRVHVIALEAYKGEHQSRMRYSIFADLYYKSEHRFKNININYVSFIYGQLDDIYGYFAEQIESRLRDIDDLNILYGGEDFAPEDLARTVFTVSEDSDLIILDHVHYFDFEEGVNENIAIKRLVKMARSLTITYGVPIVLVSHLRKKQKFSKEICASIDDFHGSSDLFKISTKVLVMGRGGITQDEGRAKAITYFRPLKNRLDSQCTYYGIKGLYDFSRGDYDSKFLLGQFRNDDTEFEVIPEHLGQGVAKHENEHYPKWAKNKFLE